MLSEGGDKGWVQKNLVMTDGPPKYLAGTSLAKHGEPNNYVVMFGWSKKLSCNDRPPNGKAK